MFALPNAHLRWIKVKMTFVPTGCTSSVEKKDRKLESYYKMILIGIWSIPSTFLTCDSVIWINFSDPIMISKRLNSNKDIFILLVEHCLWMCIR